MNKVFISGRGLMTPLGKGLQANLEALQSGKSGTVFCQEFADYDLVSQVAGVVDTTPDSNLLDRKFLRFSPPVATMSVSCVDEALKEANISREELSNMEVAIISGVAGSYGQEIVKFAKSYEVEHKMRTISPFAVPRDMPSSAVAVLSLYFGLKGESYDISAACASSTIAIINATRMIRAGIYDIVIVGGAEQIDWTQALGFCAMRALSTNNENPEKASAPFDKNRDGFVLASGAAWMVIESEEHLKKRGGKAIAEITGIASNSNATDMVIPDADSSANVMAKAVKDANLSPSDITYVNTHGTATTIGDPVELDAIKRIFGDEIAINSTKSQTGHMVGATGAAEVIFSTMMLEHQFISPNINFETPMDGYEWADIVKTTRYNVNMKHLISNNLAFGGSNASVVLSKVDENK